MAEAGVGLGIATESAARRYARRMRIAVVPLSDPWAVRERYLIMRPVERAPAYLGELADATCAHHAGK